MPQVPLEVFIARWSASAAAERAEEERNGLVRWLRPEPQNPQGDKTGQRALVEAGGKKAVKGKAAKAQPATWPKDLPSRIGAVRARDRGASRWPEHR